ncbi:aminotransferase class I/II-fold pyridoxal phosphate-dependent enzyme [Porifericola rhodea]|uniref:trans-sulfuration enzyme family protein n=1 Tax=Porifericola rhodea TaxID=930972 RepID=UPI002666E4E2|nr:aminotransferase class I/II-fold pyridoxal phosphate-dependent enzyme [Porifericola rhodea]WKN33264.1 aminotransferase class I/II-fold pyridoxal phosphate-dependent enzyme [Porifericola rhodea]
MNEQSGKATLCVHAGKNASLNSEGVNTPIFTSSAIDFLDQDDVRYPRNFNTVNQKVVSAKIAALEGSEDGLLFGSGMAAISNSILALVRSGDHVLFQKDLYGGTYQMATQMLPQFGISYSFSEPTLEAMEAAIRPETKLIYIETPSNPLLKVTDMEMVAGLAKAKGILSMIDNTFASPINQNPIAFGIDIVAHSGSKYMGGHSDLLFGAIATSHQLRQQISEGGKILGSNVNATTCALIERSLKTLALRVEKQNENAQALAEFLQEHPRVEAVYYPGLQDSPEHSIASRQMKGFGGMLSFEPALRSGAEAESLIRKFKVIAPAVSLGGVETIVNMPARTSHSLLPAEERKKAGVKDVLLRLSVGIEDSEDLMRDLDQALQFAGIYATS